LKLRTALLSGGLIALGAAFSTSQAHAQAAPFLDTPTNHWAYESVQDLAKRGIVIGYPDGTYGGRRPMTRYEFAVAIERALMTIDSMVKAQAGTPAPVGTPPATALTQDQLNEVQALIDKFRPELDTIQADLKTAQDNIEALRADVLDAKALANKAQTTADAAYSSNPKAKFTISGYIQGRYQAASAGQGSQIRFPQGVPTNSGAGQYNGTYALNSNKDSFLLRRSRLKINGAVTSNTKYGIQFDGGAGATGNTVTFREGYIAYTPGDGSAKYPTFTAGQFANFFGYQLPLSSSSILSPERPLAFNEGGNGLFNNQDYDRGVQLSYGFKGLMHSENPSYLPLKATVALINGSGLNQNSSNQLKDSVYRLAFQTEDKVFGIGASYYSGNITNPPSVTGEVPATGPGYTYRQKQLYGVDAQYISPAGPFLLAEYIGGKYEQRSFFNTPLTTSTTSALSGPTTVYAKGNHVDGYYVQGGYTFTPTGNHPFTLGASYDVFKRGEGPGSNDSYTDKNLGYGVLYNLDKATRLRFWYERPDRVAHAPGTLEPPRYGLFTGEVQVKF
jgi:hypothetical protein